MPTCDQPHSTISGVRCENPEGNHRLCTGYDAVGDTYTDWPNPSYEPPKNRSRKGAQAHLEDVATRVAPDIRVSPASASANASVPAPTGFAKGLAESQRAARRWDEREKRLVLDAIIAVAKREDEFTTDAIWAELNGTVPVTKGMTAMLRIADRQGILLSTGKTTSSTRGGEHDHGQRLTIWCSLIKGQR
jgi:hypothetical protein